MGKRLMTAAMFATVFASVAMAGEVREFRLEEARTIYPAYRTWDFVVVESGFYALDIVPPDALKDIASGAGVHLYVDGQASVFANERFLAIHAKEGGEKTVKLPRKAIKVVDLLAGATVAENAECFTICFDSPDTRLFGIEYE